MNSGFTSQINTKTRRVLILSGVLLVVFALLYLLSPSITYAGETDTYVTHNVLSTGWFVDIVKYGFVTVLYYIIFIFGKLTAVIGYGFDKAIKFSIVDFGINYNTIFATGVKNTWGAFRDIANIILISMFVFLSFNVILGSDKYGLKQLGGKVVLVAFFINFSLFFTKVIIDISNLLAMNFYSALNHAGNSTIAGAVLKSTGIQTSGSWGIYDIAFGLNGYTKDLAAVVILTFISVFLFLALSMVLLYGMVLMISRMLSFIFLMLLSAPAFASQIIPGMQHFYGKWWMALLKNAIFAPVFMLLIWASVQIITATNGPTGVTSSSLLDILHRDGAWSGIFTAIIVIGLFYGSTKIANELSLKGSNRAASLALRPITSTSIGGAAVLGRSLLGNRGKNMAENTKTRQQAASRNPFTRTIARAKIAAGNKLANSTFDVRNTKFAQDTLNKQGINLGKPIKNFNEKVEHEQKIALDAYKAQKQSQKGLPTATTPQTTTPPQNSAPVESTPIPREQIPGQTPPENTTSNEASRAQAQNANFARQNERTEKGLRRGVRRVKDLIVGNPQGSVEEQERTGRYSTENRFDALVRKEKEEEAKKAKEKREQTERKEARKAQTEVLQALQALQRSQSSGGNTSNSSSSGQSTNPQNTEIDANTQRQLNVLHDTIK